MVMILMPTPVMRMTAMNKGTSSIRFDPVDLIRLRLKRNQNALIAITGQTGSGKSMCSLELARLVDPDFTANQVVFKITDFLDLMKSLDKGRVIVFDEAGVDFDARRSSSKGNVGFSNILKTYRYLQIPTIFTLPRLTMLDINARRLFHYWIKTSGIDYKRSLCKTHWFNIDSEDDWGDKVKRYFTRVISKETNERAAITMVKFHMPPKKIVDAYEKRKDEFVRTMLAEIEAGLFKQQRDAFPNGPPEPLSPPDIDMTAQDLEMLESVAKRPPKKTTSKKPPVEKPQKTGSNIIDDPFMATYDV